MVKNKKRLIAIIATTVIFVTIAIGIICYNSRKTSVSIKQNNDKKSTRISKEKSNPKIQNGTSSSERKVHSDNSGSAVTEDSAVTMVRQHVKQDEPNASFTFDHNETRDNVEYYVIHAFDSMEDHGATTGWYYVDKSNGKVYEYDLANNKLIPIP